MSLYDDVHKLVRSIPDSHREDVLRYWGQVLCRELLARIPDLPDEVTDAIKGVQRALAGEGDLTDAAATAASRAYAAASAAATAAATATYAAATAAYAATAATAAYAAAAAYAARAADDAYAAAPGIEEVLLANLAVFA